MSPVEFSPPPNEAPQRCSRSRRATIGIYDAAGNVIETYEHKGEFKEW
jgi:hypothetical protein